MECLSEEGIRGLSYLRELEIRNCSRLTTISPVLEELPSLKTLEIDSYEDLMSLPWGIGKLSHLERLAISSCTRLTSFPQEGIGGLTSLQKLFLYRLPNLTALPEGIGGFVSLKDVSIGFCSKLSNLPATLQRLTALKSFSLWGFDNLDILPEGGLPSLEELIIYDCQNLTTSALVEGLRRLTALKMLLISKCNELSTLPAALHRLTSLRELLIWDCENLISLSEEGVRGLTALEVLDLRRCSKLLKLPAALQQLTIQTLNITGCHPELITQVERKTGEEWLKIAHVPNIYTRDDDDDDDDARTSIGSCFQTTLRES